MKKILFVTMLATTLFACKNNTSSTTTFDLEAAKSEIMAMNHSFEEFVSKGDSVGVATNCYTIDAKFMSPNGPSAEGRAAITSAISGILKSGITGIKFSTTQIWGDSTNITEEGSFDLNIKDGTVVEKGKYVVLWKKEDGKWKLHRDCFNSNMPMEKK